jgi:hypothetical protein
MIKVVIEVLKNHMNGVMILIVFLVYDGFATFDPENFSLKDGWRKFKLAH